MKRWAEMKEETAELWNLREMIGEQGRKPAPGQMYQPASVSLLLKVIYQRVSSCDGMDLVDFD